MAETGRLFFQEHSVDHANWSYEATVDFIELKGSNRTIHLLVGTGAPTGLNLNAPTGSLYINSALGTLYVKTDGTTWTAQV